MENGIDVSRSGWGNPDNHEARKPRGVQGAPLEEIEVCGDLHPDGWACDGKPGHFPATQHFADTGGVALHWGNAQTPWGHQPTDRMDLRIRSVADAALKSGSPAKWAIALDNIVAMIDGDDVV